MIKFIVNEQPSEKGIHHIHNASLGCADLPSSEDQILIGYFANYELAYKRHTQYDAIYLPVVKDSESTGNIYDDPISYTPTDKALGNHYKSLDSQQTALNLLDQIEFNDTWSVLLGGKLLHLNESAYAADGNSLRDTDFNRFLPQIALMYQPWQNTHLYASYTKGISDGSQAPAYTDNAYVTLAPRRST